MQKTIIATTTEQLDKLVKEFSEIPNVNVFATHTDWKVWVLEDKMYEAHKATIFYKDKQANEVSTGNVGVGDEAGACWEDRRDRNILNAVWKDGARTKIDFSKLVIDTKAGTWIHNENGKSYVLKTNKSQNPKAPIYRIYHA